MVRTKQKQIKAYLYPIIWIILLGITAYFHNPLCILVFAVGTIYFLTKDTEEVEQKIENLKKTAEATEESIKLIKANIANKEVQTRIAQFQDDIPGSKAYDPNLLHRQWSSIDRIADDHHR